MTGNIGLRKIKLVSNLQTKDFSYFVLVRITRPGTLAPMIEHPKYHKIFKFNKLAITLKKTDRIKNKI